MELRELKGIGEKTEALFRKAGICSVQDLLSYYPRTYEIYRKPVTAARLEMEGEKESVKGTLTKRPIARKTARYDIVTCELEDEEGGKLKLIWFHMPFLVNSLRAGKTYIVRGVAKKKNGLLMEQPEIFEEKAYGEKTEKLWPVYPLTRGLTGNMVAKAVKQALEHQNLVQDFLPESLRREYSLAELNFAIGSIHFPMNMEAYAQARRRLAFEEFFFFILALRSMKEEKDQDIACASIAPSERTDEMIRRLPYELTEAQKQVWGEIRKDFQGKRPMNRLIQGDVGCGKTILAFLAMLETAFNGFQAALMVPTEVLAEQHFHALSELLKENDVDMQVCLLTGSMTARQKKEAYEKISTGECKFMIGTHALIQEQVSYHNLALVITDEQHRFGVHQREKLTDKGAKPHIIVMSATPIPRTLALILYGDLDLSVIREMPTNRLPRKNCVVDESFRPKAWEFIRKQVEAGRQAYVICPMVEDNEKLDAENVMEYAEKLANALPAGICVSYLHGRMKGTEKNQRMREFSEGRIQVLVSTTVVEVGVNVPNATVMVVENAERFGLAGLHQLRGRVGRGKHQSYCIFISGSQKEETRQRLEILNRSNDGFLIAEEDLRLRGPGDFFGARQSGTLRFRIGDIYTDAQLLEQAASAAKRYLNGEIQMTGEEHLRLEQKVSQYLEGSARQINL